MFDVFLLQIFILIQCVNFFVNVENGFYTLSVEDNNW